MSKPIHQLRIGRIHAAIWENHGDNGAWHNVTFERTYREGETWKSSDSFGFDDLLVMAKLADQAHSWIATRRVEVYEHSATTSATGAV